MAPMIGMMTSPTSEVTMAPNAAPMMTPTARSTTLPFMANSRNSLSIGCSLQSMGREGATCRRMIRKKFCDNRALVDQAGMHHGAAHRHPCLLGDGHHRQTELLVHLAEQRHRIFDR